MQMGGLVGGIATELTAGSPLWPYVWLGQWLHVGKGTSMGLGRYTIQAASLPTAKPAED
jgi:CRISPR/Cas system endoribonuclease Cas6 (RAMP superfamily)